MMFAFPFRHKNKKRQSDIPKVKKQSFLNGQSMYGGFYGFSEGPFALNPDPRFLYLAHSHWQALSSMMSGVKEKKGTIVITGEAGVGKTILIYALLKDQSEKIKSAFVFNPRLNFNNMLENVLRDLEVPVGEKGENTIALIARFRKYLNERLDQDEIVTIVIDEAQSLDEEVLESLFRFAGPDLPAAKLLQILLVGHPELDVKLSSEKLRVFRNRIGVHCQITPLTREEGRGYISHRLKLVGRDISEVFTYDAVNRIWESAGGIPRIINLLCDRALTIGCSKARLIIDAKIVREAIKDSVYIRPSKPRTRTREFSPQEKSPYRIAGILFFLFSVCVFFLSLGIIVALLLRK